MTQPVPHWPGRLVSLANAQQVYLAQTPGDVPDGDRDVVLCVHGMSGAATNWTDFLAELVPDFAGKAVDLPGSGYSPPPSRRAGYSIKALAQTVTGLIEALDAGPVHLVGNSMGGAVCVRVAASRPDLVRTLTLISPALPGRAAPQLRFEFALAGMPFLGVWIMRRTERLSPERRVAGVIATCLYDPASVHPERFAHEVTELRRRDELGYAPVALSRAARAIVLEHLRPRRFSLWRTAQRVLVPALVLFGSDDRLVSPGLAARAAQAFPDADVVILPRTGHVAQLEHPALVAARFREMVARTRARGMQDDLAPLSPDEVSST